MSIFAMAFQPFIVNGLRKETRLRPYSVDDLLGDQSGCVPELRGQEIVFDFFGDEIPRRFLASEITRFASASFQTVRQLPADLVDACRRPWAIVQAYYAGYYAAHALARALGVSVSQVTARRAQFIQQLVKAHGLNSTAVARGQYALELEFDQRSVRLRPLGASGGGNHEVFWNSFLDVASDTADRLLLSSDVLLQSSERQTVFAVLTELTTILRGSTPQWLLTRVRNAVQYRHDYDAWLPSQWTNAKAARLSAIAKSWTGKPESIGLSASDDLECAMRCSMFLVSLLRVVVQSIQETSAVKSFLIAGPLRVLKQLS